MLGHLVEENWNTAIEQLRGLVNVGYAEEILSGESEDAIVAPIHARGMSGALSMEVDGEVDVVQPVVTVGPAVTIRSHSFPGKDLQCTLELLTGGDSAMEEFHRLLMVAPSVEEVLRVLIPLCRSRAPVLTCSPTLKNSTVADVLESLVGELLTSMRDLPEQLQRLNDVLNDSESGVDNIWSCVKSCSEGTGFRSFVTVAVIFNSFRTTGMSTELRPLLQRFRDWLQTLTNECGSTCAEVLEIPFHQRAQLTIVPGSEVLDLWRVTLCPQMPSTVTVSCDENASQETSLVLCGLPLTEVTGPKLRVASSEVLAGNVRILSSTVRSAEFEANASRSTVLLCGKGYRKLTVESSGSLTVPASESSWGAHIQALVVKVLEALCHRLVEAMHVDVDGKLTNVDVAPLLTDGLREPAAALSLSSATVAAIRKKLAIREDCSDWQYNLVERVFAVLEIKSGAKAAQSYLERRWRLDWVSVLQGSANTPIREAIGSLCVFLSHRLTGSAAPSADPAECSKQLHRWVRSGVSSDDVLKVVARQASDSAAAVDVLACAKVLPRESANVLVHKWLAVLAKGNVMSRFQAAPRETLVAITHAVVETLRLCSRDTLCSIASYSLDTMLLKDILHTCASAPPATSSISMAALRVVMRNSVLSQKPGVRISGALGKVDVERSTMGTHFVRAAMPWRFSTARSLPHYFEVTLGQNIKKARVGLCSPADVVDSVAFMRSDMRQRTLFVDSSGGRHCVRFGSGDVVGCGLLPCQIGGESSPSYFFSLNGIALLSCNVAQHPGLEYVVPFVTYDSTDKSSLSFNFGGAEFALDLSTFVEQFAPQMTLSNSDVSDAAQRALDRCFTSPSLQNTALECARRFPALMTGFACRTAAASPQLLRSSANRLLPLLVEHEWTDAGDAARVAEVVSRLLRRGASLEGDTLAAVWRFTNALEAFQPVVAQAPPAQVKSPHHAFWTHCTEDSAVVEGPLVRVLEKQDLCVAVGTALPQFGTVSFGVFLGGCGNEHNAVRNAGEFYVGVTSSTVTELDSWKDGAEPTVWAVHSVGSSQLEHCDDAALASELHPFTTNMTVTVTLDREKGTLSLAAGSTTVFSDVFRGIPPDATLRPFVQLVGEKSYALLTPGSQTDVVSVSTVVSGALVRMQRALLARAETASQMAGTVREQMKAAFAPGTGAVVSRARSETLWCTLGNHGNPSNVRVALLDGTAGFSAELVQVDVVAASQLATVRARGGRDELVVPLEALRSEVEREHSPRACVGVSDEDLPPLVDDDSDADDDDVDSAHLLPHEGLASIVGLAAESLLRWGSTFLSRSELEVAESDARNRVEDEERQLSTTFDVGLCSLSYDATYRLNSGLMSSLMQSSPIPTTHTFSVNQSSPELHHPKHYLGKLVLTPHCASKTGVESYFAVSQESVPRKGVHNVRLKVEFDWMGLLALRTFPMPEGLYVGLCTKELSWRNRYDHTKRSPPMIWALPSLDTPEYHLPHSTSAPTSAFLIFSRDIIRLNVNRETRSLEVFRTPHGRPEVSLGILFDALPDEALNPFVMLSSARTAVMFLPTSAPLPRRERNEIRYAPTVGAKGHSCDGCLNQFVHATVEAPNWYRCNQCLNFDLCATCFHNHFHCGHTFSHMRPASYVPSPIADRSLLSNGADVEVAASPLLPIRFENCTVASETFHLVAEPLRTDDPVAAGPMLGVWGVLRKPRSATELFVLYELVVTAVLPSSSALPRLVVAGVAPLGLLTSTQDVTTLLSRAPVVCFPVVTRASERRAPTAPDALLSSFRPTPELRSNAQKWNAGDELRFVVRSDGTVDVSRNGSVLGTCATPWAADERLGLFFVSTEPMHRFRARPASDMMLVGKVAEVNTKQALARVTNGVASRWCHASQLHAPLSQVKRHAALRVGMQVFAAVKQREGEGRFTECVIVNLGGGVDSPITVHDGERSFTVALHALFASRAALQTCDPDDDHPYPDVKRRLRRFYQHYAPTKTDADMDRAIELYAKSSKGHKGMWVDLENKYGKEPPQAVAFPVLNSSKARRRPTAAVAPPHQDAALEMLQLVVQASQSPDAADVVASLTGNAAFQRFLNESESSSEIMHQQGHGELPSPLVSVPFPEGTSAAEATPAPLPGAWQCNARTEHGGTIELLLDAANPTRCTVTFSAPDTGRVWRFAVAVRQASWSPATTVIAIDLDVDERRCDDSDAVSALEFVASNVPATSSLRCRRQLQASAVRASSTVPWFSFECYANFVTSTFDGEWWMRCGASGTGWLSPADPRASMSELLVPALGRHWALPPPTERAMLSGRATRVAAVGDARRKRGVKDGSFEAALYRLRLFGARHHRPSGGNDAGMSARSTSALLRDLIRASSEHHDEESFATLIAECAAALSDDALCRLLSAAQCMCRCPSTNTLPLQQRAAAARILHIALIRIVRLRSALHLGDLLWSSLHSVVAALHEHCHVLDLWFSLASLLSAVAPSQRPRVALLLSPLHHFVLRLVQHGFTDRAWMSAVVNALALIAAELPASLLPLKDVALVCDAIRSMHNGEALPKCLDADCVTAAVAETGRSSAAYGATLWQPLGSATRLQHHQLFCGTAVSSAAVQLSGPPTVLAVRGASDARVVVGLCNEAFLQRERNPNGAGTSKQGAVPGFDRNSIAFDGTCWFHDGRATRHGYLRIDGGESLVVCVDMPSRCVCITVNQVLLPAVAIPECLANEPLYVLVRTSTSATGVAVKSRAVDLVDVCVPQGARPLHDEGINCSVHYHHNERSPVPVLPTATWARLANEEVTAAPPGVTPQHLRQIQNLIAVAMQTLPALEHAHATHTIYPTLSTLKQLLRPTLRAALVEIPVLEVGERHRLPQVAVRWFSLFSADPRTPEVALEHTVLAQLQRQLGNRPTAMTKDPMFVTALSMSESTHTPIDAGGPYSQTWSLLAEELMADEGTKSTPSSSAPGVDGTDAASVKKFWRNPLFRFVSSTKGKMLLPDSSFRSPRAMTLFRFFGAVLGYLVKSKRCVALEMCPVVWKYLVEDPVAVKDYLDSLDANVAACLDDDDFLGTADGEAMFPGLSDAVQLLERNAGGGAAVTRRAAAEHVLVHSLDGALNAIREGLWSTLPRSAVRMMTAAELALKVCGEPFPTYEQFKDSVVASLPQPFEDMFWRCMKELSPAEWSAFFFFASAQRRYPLSRKITVTPTKQSEEHIPQASTCFAHISTPLYSSLEKWVAKFRQAIACQDMELA